jgi:kinesin family member 11
MQEALEEERRRSAEERQKMLSQITNLINTQAEAQEARIFDRAAQIQESMAESSQSIESAVTQHAQGMQSWDEAEGQFLENIKQSRDQLKTKLKDDWNSASEKSTSIQNTAKSVHAETVRVVDEQVEDLDVQMEALDDFVARAKSENASQHESHAQSVKAVSNTVDQSFGNISAHFKTSFERVKTLGEDMSSDVNDLHDSLEPLDTQLCQPLANLREDISSTTLQEYQPTGATPQKVQYQYTKSLPRTQRHSLLVSKMDEDETVAGSEGPDASDKEHTMVFADLDHLKAEESSPRPSTASTGVSSGDKIAPLSMMSLREVNPNITTNLTTSAIAFDPRASPLSIPADHTMPLFKPSARTTRGVQKPGSLGSLGEGRENQPLSAFSQSVSRRKSPRLN